MGSRGNSLLRTALAAAAFVAAVTVTGWAPLWPQSPGALSTPAQSPSQFSVPEWQIGAGGKMAFDVASVKQTTTAPTSFNFPLGPGDVYVAEGGLLKAIEPPIGN